MNRTFLEKLYKGKFTTEKALDELKAEKDFPGDDHGKYIALNELEIKMLSERLKLINEAIDAMLEDT